MEEINKFRIFNKLKSVNRASHVNDRKESSAEHSWSCLILADYFLSKLNLNIDRVKVYELLMYHDVVEIETGDLPLHPDIIHTNKLEQEEKALNKLEKELPEPLNKKFVNLSKEFIDRKTIEAKFAKAIDILDSDINELDNKNDWKGWTKEFLIEKRQKYFEEFPELNGVFNKILDELIKNNYIEK